MQLRRAVSALIDPPSRLNRHHDLRALSTFGG
jgi:hypothetical protein